MRAPVNMSAESLNGKLETIDDYKEPLDAAGVPYRYRRKKFSELGDAGEIARQYLDHRTGQFLNDLDDNRGVVVIGEAHVRNSLFPMLARAAVLREDSVYYIQLSELADALTTPEDSNLVLDKCYKRNTLFIEDFYDGNIECRYDKRELRRIESLLRDRLNNDRRLFLSTSRGVEHMTWFSRGLQDLIIETSRMMAV